MDDQVERGGAGNSREPVERDAGVGFALPFFMAVFVAFIVLLEFWPGRLGNRMAYGEEMYLGGLTVAVMMGVGVLLAGVVVCATQLLRR